jgi:hypothetical protein
MYQAQVRHPQVRRLLQHVVEMRIAGTENVKAMHYEKRIVKGCVNLEHRSHLRKSSLLMSVVGWRTNNDVQSKFSLCSRS